MILVTGSNGFLGSAFVERIQEKGENIFKYDLPNYDILKINNLEKQFYIDMVIHFAAMANVNESYDNQDKNFDVNVRGTYEVAKFCRINKIPMIYVSTCCAYGNTKDAVEFEDNTVINPVDPYGCSKVAGEYIVKGMPGLEWSILRFGTVYGPGMRPALFNHIAFDKNIKGEPIFIDGTGEQTRQYIYVDDLVAGVIKAVANFDFAKGNIINLCGDKSYSVIETLKLVEKITNKPYTAIIHREFRYGDTLEENISIAKAKSLLGWSPLVDYEMGMRLTYDAVFK